MKTPRFALLALALAVRAAAGPAVPTLTPASTAALTPTLATWPIADEGYRRWPTIRFKVGSEMRVLRCRYSECEPSKKGQSDLYLFTEIKKEDFKATIYDLVERSKYNPLRYISDVYDKVPREVAAVRTYYSTTLSHYKLDNTGAELAVVQGATRIPAVSDVNERQWSAAGNAIQVQPPKGMAEDKVAAAAVPAPSAAAPTGAGAGTMAADQSPADPDLSLTDDAPAGDSAGAPAAPATPPLTAQEIAVLTPEEARNYDSNRISATGAADPKLQDVARQYRERIAKDGRLDAAPIPASADMTLEKFKALPPFQQRQFCANYQGGGAAVSADARGGEIDNGPDALAAVRATVANAGPRPGDAPKSAPEGDWKNADRRDACRGLPPEASPVVPTAGQTAGTSAGAHAIDNLDNKEPEAKKSNSWLKKDLLHQGARGMLLGLVIGSLFGPIGLVAGPLIGGALFYGLAKKEAMDADKKK